MREVHGDLGGNLPGALAIHLVKLGIPFDLVEEEIGRMTEVAYGKTTSRQVLGVMNEYAFMAKILSQRLRQSPGHVSLRLAETPVGPLKEHFPVDATRNLLFDTRRRESIFVVPPDLS